MSTGCWLRACVRILPQALEGRVLRVAMSDASFFAAQPLWLLLAVQAFRGFPTTTWPRFEFADSYPAPGFGDRSKTAKRPWDPHQKPPLVPSSLHSRSLGMRSHASWLRMGTKICVISMPRACYFRSERTIDSIESFVLRSGR